MHDSLKLEEHGIPSVAVATHEFSAAARIQASLLGRPDFDAVYVPHPIQDRTRDEIEEKADGTAEEIAARLVTR